MKKQQANLIQDIIACILQNHAEIQTMKDRLSRAEEELSMPFSLDNYFRKKQRLEISEEMDRLSRAKEQRKNHV